jgi:hypothetical protein
MFPRGLDTNFYEPASGGPARCGQSRRRREQILTFWCSSIAACFVHISVPTWLSALTLRVGVLTALEP